MAELLATMPVLPLTPGCVVRFEAIDPTTGVPVSGVTVSLATIFATDLTGDETGLGNSGPFMLVPGPGAASTNDAPLILTGGL